MQNQRARKKKTCKRKKLLTNSDRKQINYYLTHEASSRTYRRALMLKMTDEGYLQGQIVDLKIACERTIRNIIKKYTEEGLNAALYDRPRQGQPRRFTRKQEERIAAVVCSDPPAGQARWTLSLIKEYSEKEKIVDSISQESIRILLSSRDILPRQMNRLHLGL